MSLSVLSAAAEAPGAPALFAGGQPLRFADLGAEARRALGWLAAQGVGPGQRVALVPRPDVGTVVLVHALLELGAPAVLVHPRLAAPERARLLAGAGASLVVEAPDAARPAWRGAAPDPRPPGLVPDDDRLAAVLYTSGTTGAPRGVRLCRAALAAAAGASAANLGWRPDDRWLLCMPPAHIGGLSILLRCLHGRRPVVLGPAGPFDPAAVAAALARDGVTLLSLVPTMLQRLLDELPGWAPPPRLRAVLLGGAPASAALLSAAAARGVPALCTYGLTEACAQAATQRPGTPPDPAQGCGPPLPGVEVRFVEGEIQLRGPALLSGYDDGTSPLLPGGWLPTGDLGRLDEAGRLHVLGRRDDLVITGGENVHPAEVEPALLEAPGVRGACVFGAPDPLWGQVVAAALVADPPPPDAALAAHLRARLAGHRRPRLIAYIGALPLTAAGKPDRRAAAVFAATRLRPLLYE